MPMPNEYSLLQQIGLLNAVFCFDVWLTELYIEKRVDKRLFDNII